MEIRLEEITDKGLDVRFSRGEDWLNELFLDGRGVEFSFASPLSVAFTLARSGRNVFVEGAIEVLLTLTCGRCLNDFVYPIYMPVRTTLVPLPKTTRPHTECELRGDDLELSFYDGEEIDLSQVVREQVFLSMPSYPLCCDGCKGLCPACGVNLNVEICQCGEKARDCTLTAAGSLERN